MASPTGAQFAWKLATQNGAQYIYGAEVNLNDPNPKAKGRPFDCSELTEWGAHEIGLYLPDGANNQQGFCRQHGTIIPVAQALRTIGALLFHGPNHPHVAVSLGNNSTIEAKNHLADVGVFSALNRGWTSAALLPGANYAWVPAVAVPPAVPIQAPVPAGPNVFQVLALSLKLAKMKVVQFNDVDGQGDNAVAWVQKGIQKFAQVVPPNVIGRFEKETYKGVCNVQHFAGLKVDGVVGPKTWGVLFP